MSTAWARRRNALGAGLALALAVALVQVPVAAAADGPAPTVDVASTSEDFAGVAYGDPWDFDDVTDMRLLPDRMSATTADARMEAGELRFSARNGASLLTFVFPGYGGAMYMERDGGATPINADRYTHVAMRIYSPSQRVMSFSYDRCLAAEGTADFCRVSTANVVLQQGWNTVVRDLRELSAGTAHPWAGKVYAFRMSNAVGEGYRVEYVRLQTAPEVVEVTWDPTLGSELYWDRNADLADNTTDASGWGRVDVVAPGRGVLPAGGLEPGEYRFYARSGDTASAYGPPLHVVALPTPVVLDPDFAGGEDFATVANGEPWDFTSPGDVIASGGFADATFGPGGLSATNTNNDPFVYLRMDRPLDADRYHRLTVHTTYEGGFNLADVSGGGTHGRFLWTRADRDQDRVIQGNKVLESRELVHYPGQASFTVDLKTPPDPTFLMETDRPERDGWSTGSPVTHLRYDPNEDRGPRRWNLSRVELRATDEASGSFTIRWRDDASTVPVTVALYYIFESGATERLIASGIQQVPGENAYRWDTTGVPPGRYRIRVTGDNGVGQGTNLSSGPVDVRTSLRVAGQDRLSTAVALSALAFPDGASTAILARSGGFPDALAAAPLAAAADGPLLLNSTDKLEEPVRQELNRLGVDTVYVMGGESAQSALVVAQVEALGVDVIRVSGVDRFRTAAAAATVSVRLWQREGREEAGSEAIVALGSDFPDALAAGPLSGHSRRPLLLTGRDEVPDATLEALDELGVEHMTVVGGIGAVSGEAYDRLAAGRSAERIAGGTRHETAALVAQAAVAAGADDDVVVVASGRTFADALAAGPAVQQLGGVLLLTEPGVLPQVTRGWVAARSPMTLLRVAGGAAVVSNTVEAELIAANS